MTTRSTTRSIWRTGMVYAVVVLLAGWSTRGRSEDEAGTDMAVADGKQVALEYTLTLDDGTQVGTNVGQEPLVYIHGRGELVRGLEQGLLGLKTGDKKKILVSPQDAYGERDSSRTHQVPLERIPEQARQVGAQLQGTGPDGQVQFAKVIAISDTSATIDTNHPLAGQELTFDVTILKIENIVRRIEPPPSATLPAEASP